MPRDPRTPPPDDTVYRQSLVERHESDIRAGYRQAVAQGIIEPVAALGERDHPMIAAMEQLAKAKAPPDLEHWLFLLPHDLMLPFWHDQSPQTVGQIPNTHIPVMVFARDGTLIAAISKWK